MKNYLFPLLLLSLNIAACRKHEDPCLASANAEFIIEEHIQDRWFRTDSVSGAYPVRFRALHPADSFVWLLGSQVIRGQSEVIKNAFPVGSLSCRLIAYRSPNPACNPNDDGIDTLTRSFYCWPYGYISWFGQYYVNADPNFPIYGHYRGHLESNPSEEFVVSLLDSVVVNPPNITPDTFNQQVVRNIPYRNFASNQGCPYCSSLFVSSPMALYIDIDVPLGLTPPFFPILQGYAYLDYFNPNEITIEYTYKDIRGDQSEKSEVFKGHKVYK